MIGRIFSSKILVAAIAILFIAGSGYSVWRSAKTDETANLADQTSGFKLVEEVPLKKIETTSAPAKNTPKPKIAQVVVVQPKSIPAPTTPISPEPTPPAPPSPEAPEGTAQPESQPPSNNEPAPEPPPPPALPSPEASEGEAHSEPVVVQIVEIQTGTTAGGAEDEYVKLYNPTNTEIDLAGYALKKKSSTGTISNLVSAGAFTGKIAAKGYFIVAHQNYGGINTVNLVYSANSNNLAYTNNSVVLYDTNGAVMDEISWTEIPKDIIWTRP